MFVNITYMHVNVLNKDVMNVILFGVFKVCYIQGYFGKKKPNLRLMVVNTT